MREFSMCDGRVVVIDDVLDRASLDSMLADLDRTPLDSVDHRAAPIWDHRGDANPSVGERIVWCERVSALPETLPGLPKYAQPAMCWAIGSDIRPDAPSIAFSVAIDAARRSRTCPGTSADRSPGPWPRCALLRRRSPAVALRWNYLGPLPRICRHWSENGGGHRGRGQPGTEGGRRRADHRASSGTDSSCWPLAFVAVLSVASDVEHPRVGGGFFVNRRVSGLIATGLKLLRCGDATVDEAVSA